MTSRALVSTARAAFSAWLALAALLLTAPAAAQSWAANRNGPRLNELFAVDRTGEPNWLYGSEDLAGDGLDQFQQQERSIDIRTAYAATDNQSLWVRTYVSDTANPGGNISVYLFIDADQNSGTGGRADATNVNDAFTSDPSAGGYEWVVGLGGNESVVGLWQWDGSAFATANFQPAQIEVETGTDTDPIRLNEPDHGYVQGRIELALIELTPACDANLYVRSTNDTSLSAGDLEVAEVAACVPHDGDGDGVPDPVEPPGECTSDDQCPGDGICQGGRCVIATPCIDDSDCDASEECTSDGRCVPRPTGSCTDSSECSDGLVCSSGQCTACQPGGSECGDGRVCAPTGRCVDDTGPGAGPNLTDADVRGGACSCELPADDSGSRAWLLLLIPLALGARRSRRRHRC